MSYGTFSFGFGVFCAFVAFYYAKTDKNFQLLWWGGLCAFNLAFAWYLAIGQILKGLAK
jgi:hypothetical protein